MLSFGASVSLTRPEQISRSQVHINRVNDGIRKAIVSKCDARPVAGGCFDIQNLPRTRKPSATSCSQPALHDFPPGAPSRYWVSVWSSSELTPRNEDPARVWDATLCSLRRSVPRLKSPRFAALTSYPFYAASYRVNSMGHVLCCSQTLNECYMAVIHPFTVFLCRIEWPL